MIGGLFKSASRLALVTVAGVLVGGISAQAADLGGDCCADLEERVAELEATTARKGNRKVSLAISGWVHQSIMYWDDGQESNTYVGQSHLNLQSRFRFVGQAKINPEWSAGYMMEFGLNPGGLTSLQNQNQDNSANAISVRHSSFWIDSKSMGRVWLGLTDMATAGIQTINLANVNLIGFQKVGLTQGGFLLRGTNGALSTRTWGNLMTHGTSNTTLGDITRNNGIRYVSPTVAGFIFSAAYGEDDFWDVALRYAGEFAGFKIAAGIGYGQTTDGNTTLANAATGAGPIRNFNSCAIVGTGSDKDCNSLNGSISVMHVATGLFVTGSAGRLQDDNRNLAHGALNGAQAGAMEDTDTQWSIMAGIEQNWTGLGKTTLFGEYVDFEGAPMSNGAGITLAAGDVAALGGAAGHALTKSEIQVWGLGIVQTIDAAALDLYLSYRNYSTDVYRTTAGGVTSSTLGIDDFQVIQAGGRIQF